MSRDIRDYFNSNKDPLLRRWSTISKTDSVPKGPVFFFIPKARSTINFFFLLTGFFLFLKRIFSDLFFHFLMYFSYQQFRSSFRRLKGFQNRIKCKSGLENLNQVSFVHLGRNKGALSNLFNRRQMQKAFTNSNLHVIEITDTCTGMYEISNHVM